MTPNLVRTILCFIACVVGLIWGTNRYDFRIKVDLYRECLETNKQLARDNDQRRIVGSVSCYAPR